MLARREVNCDNRPARRLWCRAGRGRCLPDPALLLRHVERWQPVYESLNLAWVDRGCVGETLYWAQPAQLLG